MTLETRALIRPVEIRATENSTITVVGYAALFGSHTIIGDTYREVIARGAFAETIKGDVRALFNHDSGRVLGRTVAKTLRLAEDATGLATEIDLPDTTDGRDVATLIERGDISGMSFGFNVTKQTWDETGDMPTRTIEAVDLREVSPVTFPQYTDTSIALRSLDAARLQARADNYNAAAARLRMKASLDLRTRR